VNDDGALYRMLAMHVTSTVDAAHVEMCRPSSTVDSLAEDYGLLGPEVFVPGLLRWRAPSLRC
jgi:hypothetical protein